MTREAPAFNSAAEGSILPLWMDSRYTDMSPLWSRRWLRKGQGRRAPWKAPSAYEVLITVMVDSINRWLTHPEEKVRSEIGETFGSDEALQIAFGRRNREPSAQGPLPANNFKRWSGSCGTST